MTKIIDWSIHIPFTQHSLKGYHYELDFERSESKKSTYKETTGYKDEMNMFNKKNIYWKKKYGDQWKEMKKVWEIEDNKWWQDLNLGK